MKKKILSLALAGALLLSFFVPTASATDGGGVLARLQYLQTQPGYQVGNAEYNCYTFVQRVVANVFDISGANINYHGDFSSSNNMQLIGRCYTSMPCSVDSCGGKDPVSKEAQGYTIGKVTIENVRTLISRAAIGDVLQGHRGFNVHTMIIQGITKDANGVPVSVTVYQGNVADSVQISTYSLEEVVQTYGHALSVYRANDYYIIDSGTSIFYNANGGSASYTSQFVDGGAAVGSMPAATRLGYDFGGWYAEDGSRYDENSVLLGSAIYLTAKWTPQSFTVTYDANGGSASASTKTVTYGSGYGKLASAEREGYTFAGWSLSAKSDGTILTADSPVATARDHTLYAQWTPNVYDVDLHPTDGAFPDGVADTAQVTFGTTYAGLPTPVLDGYILLGWSTNKEGTDLLTANSPVTIAKDHDLYARWVKEFKSVPSGFTATSSSPDTCTLSWTQVPEATGYEIYRSANGEAAAKVATVEDPSVTVYTDTDCAEGRSYTYSVRAYQTTAELTQYGANTAEQTVVAQVRVPAVPGKFRVSETAPTYASLSWSAVDGATYYEVCRSATGEDGTFVTLYRTANTTTTNTGLERGTDYFYKIRAIRAVADGLGIGECTASVKITTKK